MKTDQTSMARMSLDVYEDLTGQSRALGVEIEEMQDRLNSYIERKKALDKRAINVLHSAVVHHTGQRSKRK